MTSRTAVVLLALAGALSLAACADTHSGLNCPTQGFSGTQCRDAIAAAQCKDGGVEPQAQEDAGTLRLCCAYEDCASDPFPTPSPP